MAWSAVSPMSCSTGFVPYRGILKVVVFFFVIGAVVTCFSQKFGEGNNFIGYLYLRAEVLSSQRTGIYACNQAGAGRRTDRSGCKGMGIPSLPQLLTDPRWGVCAVESPKEPRKEFMSSLVIHNMLRGCCEVFSETQLLNMIQTKDKETTLTTDPLLLNPDFIMLAYFFFRNSNSYDSFRCNINCLLATPWRGPTAYAPISINIPPFCGPSTMDYLHIGHTMAWPYGLRSIDIYQYPSLLWTVDCGLSTYWPHHGVALRPTLH